MKINNWQYLASIIIPTYGRAKYLEDTLYSVSQQTLSYGNFEVIIVDNKPTGEALKIYNDFKKKWYGTVVYLKEARIGLHHARHSGAKAARGEILIYIDDDVLVSPEWLEAILSPFSNSRVACSGGKIVPKWEGSVPSWLGQFDGGYLSLLDLGIQTKELTEPNVWGCNMAVRKSVLFEVGGFNPDGVGDKRFIWLRGDGECGLENKILKRGLKIIYEPRAWLYHRIPESRLVPQYFYWRLFIQGIDDSYRYVRSHRLYNFFVLHMSKRIVISILQSVRKLALSLVLPNQRIRLRSDACYFWGIAEHLMRVLLNKKLRLHVLKESYL
jgi:glucosyl-dolichyl phosphate glucuronosyltransferase